MALDDLCHLGPPSYSLEPFLSWSGAFGAARSNEATKFRDSGAPLGTDSLDLCFLSGAR